MWDLLTRRRKMQNITDSFNEKKNHHHDHHAAYSQNLIKLEEYNQVKSFNTEFVSIKGQHIHIRQQ